jgi:hypothetical protein
MPIMQPQSTNKPKTSRAIKVAPHFSLNTWDENSIAFITHLPPTIDSD